MFRPNSRAQLAALEAADFCDEVIFAGERGGGKSFWQCGYQEDGALRFEANHRGIMFRKTFPELEELQAAAMQVFPATGATYKTQPSASFPFSNSWYWPSGAVVRMRYMEAERDYGRYHGHQFTRISFDEITEYASPTPVLKMISTLRSPQGVPCSMALTGNPGGIGHVWMRARLFMAPPLHIFDDPETGLSRIFVPSKLRDNRDLMRGDPGYVKRLLAATQGNEALRRAWMEGDWDVLAGAFFDNFSREQHVIRPFPIPQQWTRFVSFDWGSAKPFSVGWWAVSTGEPVKLRDGRVLWFPAGAIIRYREWYGKKNDEHNVGLKMVVEQVAQGILDREKNAGEKLCMPDDQHNGSRIAYRVADPSCFREDGGPSLAERMRKVGCQFRPADNSRIPGWDQVRARLEGDDGVPLMYLFDTCLDTIRTLPALIHDENRIEDLDCWVAGTMVSTPSGDRPIEDIVAGDFIETPIGPRRVLKSYVSGSGSTCWVETEDGTRLQGTPHHKIFIIGHGLRRLDELQCEDVLLRRGGSWPKLLNIAVRFIEGTRGACTTTKAAAVALFTELCGAMLMGRFLLGMTSTTLTETTTTTALRTSRPFRKQSTHANISPQGEMKWPSYIANGALHGKDEYSFKPTQKKCTRIHRSVHLRASIVALLLLQNTLCKFAAKHAQNIGFFMDILRKHARFVGLNLPPRPTRPRRSEPARIVAVGRCEEKTLVYNLTVEDAHLFYANHILSSNTDGEDHALDDVRYGCMSRPLDLSPKKKKSTEPKPHTYAWLEKYAGGNQPPARSKYRMT